MMGLGSQAGNLSEVDSLLVLVLLLMTRFTDKQITKFTARTFPAKNVKPQRYNHDIA